MYALRVLPGSKWDETWKPKGMGIGYRPNAGASKRWLEQKKNANRISEVYILTFFFVVYFLGVGRCCFFFGLLCVSLKRVSTFSFFGGCNLKRPQLYPRWWFQICVSFLGTWSNLTIAYFPNGLVQPTTNWIFPSDRPLPTFLNWRPHALGLPGGFGCADLQMRFLILPPWQLWVQRSGSIWVETKIAWLVDVGLKKRGRFFGCKNIMNISQLADFKDFD